MSEIIGNLNPSDRFLTRESLKNLVSSNTTELRDELNRQLEDAAEPLSQLHFTEEDDTYDKIMDKIQNFLKKHNNRGMIFPIELFEITRDFPKNFDDYDLFLSYVKLSDYAEFGVKRIVHIPPKPEDGSEWEVTEEEYNEEHQNAYIRNNTSTMKKDLKNFKVRQAELETRIEQLREELGRGQEELAHLEQALDVGHSGAGGAVIDERDIDDAHQFIEVTQMSINSLQGSVTQYQQKITDYETMLARVSDSAAAAGGGKRRRRRKSAKRRLKSLKKRRKTVRRRK